MAHCSLQIARRNSFTLSSASNGLWVRAGIPGMSNGAYDGERVWILQARPVTVSPRAGWSATASLPCYWSTANLKDNLPGVPSELTWSALCKGISEALYAAQRAAKYGNPQQEWN